VKARICVTLFGRNLEELRKNFRKVTDGDLFEIRVDLSGSLNFKALRKLTSKPLIATCRLKGEGGGFKGSERERLNLLREAAQAGFDYVDLELSTRNLQARLEEFREAGVKILISSHNLNRTPSFSQLKTLLNRQLNFSPDICKIVGFAKKMEDNLTMLRFLLETSKNSKGRIVAFCMGELGLPSRVLSPLFGGYFTYASATPAKAAAPGQLDFKSLREIYRKLGVDP